MRVVSVERMKTFVPATRSDQPAETATVNPDDLIEVEFESGERLWLRADDYRARFAPVSAARDVETGQPIIDVPIELPLVAPGLVSRDTRGAASWVVKSLKVIGIDLAGKSAAAIARLVEGKKTEDGRRPGLGLFRGRLDTGAFALTTPTTAAPDGKPWLLFIHGTGSTTWGSFGELWSVARQQQLAKLREQYGDRVLAFEHRTLTHSPIRNARDLLTDLHRVLPGGAPLDVVTHSRGGLVGELLVRTEVSDEELDLFSPRDDRTIHPDDARTLSELHGLLQARSFPVRRFVRVACPALGTTLASGRLDRWLSVIGTLAGFLPGSPVADMFADLGDFVAAVIQERTNPATLPGVEAMMPDSQCIKLVNWPATIVDGSIAVIAGDIDPGKWWARLAVWLSDRFYEGDHDLVVNTPSMYGGAQRSRRAVVSFHKADAVNHFTYFSEQSSADRLITALTSRDEDDWPGFLPLHPPKVAIARAAQTAPAGPRPAVFVLPGIMGSELAIGARPVWVSLLQLVRGGLADLHVEAADVRALKPVERYYGRICAHLERTHQVVPFAYDWRLDIGGEADRLAQAVRAQLAITRPQNQPIRILAHSMGGLVTRAMIARHPQVWAEVCEHPDARLIMLGTPNGGSHAIPELLVGQSVVFRKLARLDVRHRAETLLDIIGRFPGILAMLPEAAEENLFSARTWQEFHDRAGAGWIVPDEARLKAARDIRQTIADSPIDPGRMIYVAGSADVTVAAMRLEKRPGETRDRIVFRGTTRGDGRVTWDSGIPQALSSGVYYMDVQHGDMAADERSFPAVEELLTRGETRLLPRTPPVAREAAVMFEMPRAEDDRYPDADDLVAAVLGAGTRAQVMKKAPQRAVRVRVVHGNLAFASYPVAVGHYRGDTIVSAEKHLDRALQFALTQRLHLGLYPGAVETNAIFANPQRATDPYARPAGAIVVGLGTVGTLSASSLTRSFSRALLEFVLEDRKHRPGAPGETAAVGVSTLLVGTGAGGMSVSDSVFALVRGAQRANEALAAAQQPDRIAELEFIELYHDRAILALESLDRLSRRVGVAEAFVLIEGLVSRDGGLHRVTYDEEPEWWQRLQILGSATDGGRDQALRFAALTRRARTEVRLLPTQRTLVDQFIDRTLATTRHDKAVARTLFDLLLPNELKESAPDQDNLVLLLDDESARYPWELLENSESRGQGPFAIEHGLLRQLEAREFREQVRGTVERSALVIGDPVSQYVELSGAQHEAEAVSRVLKSSFTTVNKRVRPASQEVITALFERPYRVLHLAGHGVYRFTPPGRQTPVTGMVIGDNAFLTPGEIAQLRSVPELVFINCCHLGRVENGQVGATPQELAFPRLAANVATEFIRIGVRAVVAAGWAVEDVAATTFATTFYQQLLSGETFGEAVKLARKTTYDQHASSNTWGAYQCYGDPDFRLVFRRERLAQQQEPRFLSPAHVVRDLGNITARLKTHSSMGQDEEVRQLDAIVKAVEKKGWSSGAIHAGLGRAYGEAGKLDVAVKYYCSALSSEDGAVTARDVEQWANLTSRLAMERAKANAADDAVRAQASTDIRRSIRVLKGLLGGAGGAHATAERLALIGSAYKRRAVVDPARRADSLRRMAEYYGKSVNTARTRGAGTAYSLVSLRWAELAMRWQGLDITGIADGDLATDLEKIRKEIAEREQADGPQFWQDNMRVDCELLEAIAGGVPDDATLLRVAGKYAARRQYASAREFASVSDHLDFLVDMSEQDELTTLALRNLRERLRSTATPAAQP